MTSTLVPFTLLPDGSFVTFVETDSVHIEASAPAACLVAPRSPLARAAVEVSLNGGVDTPSPNPDVDERRI